MNVLEFPDLDFKRLSKDGATREINEIIETYFLNLGIQYANIYARDSQEFKRMFLKMSVVRGACVWIYWSYRQHKLCEEVKPEPGESNVRLAARKIVEVFKVIQG